MGRGEQGGAEALDGAERAFRETRATLRLAQIYLFWLLLDAFLRPLIFLNQWIAHLLLAAAGAIVPALAPGAPPDPALLTGFAREPLFAVALLAVWALFAINARMLTHWSLWPAAAAVALYNLDTVRRSAIGDEAEAFEAIRDLHFGPGAPDLSPMADAAAMTVFLIYAAFHVHILYIAFRAQRALARMEPETRRAMADLGPESGVVAGSLRRLLYLPAALRYARRRALAAVFSLAAGVSNLINYWLALMAALGLVLIPLGGALVWIAVRAESGGKSAVAAGAAALVATLLIAIFGGAAFLLTKLVAAFQRWARAFMRRSLMDMQAADPRPPVLFLRSFLDDQVALPTRDPTWEQWLLDASTRSLNFDHIALEEGSGLGPVVALGDPSDPAPPFGAARGYFDHSDWRGAVARLCDEATAVMLVLDETEGVKWEINRLSGAPLLGKTLYLLAPGDVDAPRGRALMARALRSNGWEETLAATPGLFAVWRDVGGRARALTTKSASAYAYLIALRLFLRREAAR